MGLAISLVADHDQCISLKLMGDLELTLVVDFNPIVRRPSTILGVEVMQVKMLRIAAYVHTGSGNGTSALVQHTTDKPIRTRHANLERGHGRSDRIGTDAHGGVAGSFELESVLHVGAVEFRQELSRGALNRFVMFDRRKVFPEVNDRDCGELLNRSSCVSIDHRAGDP